MSINFDQLSQIHETLKKFPKARLQIVTKNRSSEIIKELIINNYYLFGENKVQEAKEKFEDIERENIELHLIGPLQTNKVKLALQIFDTIQSVDRIKLVNEIVKYQTNIETKTRDYFIQINIGREDQKAGVQPDGTQELYDICVEKGLMIVGLMCIPPINKEPEVYFNKMKELRDNINPNLKLSMGMSADYKISLMCGSDLVRVGSRIVN